ncbi:MAG: hypothetical protein ACYTEI_12295, partial [Planctomycetota bacterium]
MPRSKTARWLDLIAYLLQHRYPVTREQVFESVSAYLDEDARDEATARESARRKFERDKDELRSLGISIETVELPQAAGDEPGQGYLLKERDFYLPYLELVREEDGGGEPRSARQPYRGLRRLPVTRAELELLDRATRRLAEREELPLAAAARSARRKLAFDLPVPLRAVEKALAQPLSDDARKSLEVLQTAVAEHTAVAC